MPAVILGTRESGSPVQAAQLPQKRQRVRPRQRRAKQGVVFFFLNNNLVPCISHFCAFLLICCLQLPQSKRWPGPSFLRPEACACASQRKRVGERLRLESLCCRWLGVRCGLVGKRVDYRSLSRGSLGSRARDVSVPRSQWPCCLHSEALQIGPEPRLPALQAHREAGGLRGRVLLSLHTCPSKRYQLPDVTGHTVSATSSQDTLDGFSCGSV